MSIVLISAYTGVMPLPAAIKMIRLYFSGCSGSTKNPDAPTIRKMLQIASALNAKVQGDDGEFYTEEYLAELESEEKPKSVNRQYEKKAWWKFW